MALLREIGTMWQDVWQQVLVKWDGNFAVELPMST